MAIVKRSYLEFKALIAGLLAFCAGVIPGFARTSEPPAQAGHNALVSQFSDSRAYDRLLAREDGGEASVPMRPSPRQVMKEPAPAPESGAPDSQPAQALKLKPGEQPKQTFEAWPAGKREQPQQALKLKPGEQPKQTFEAWPAGKDAQPKQALKLKPGEQQPRQALKLKPGEQAGPDY